MKKAVALTNFIGGYICGINVPIGKLPGEVIHILPQTSAGIEYMYRTSSGTRKGQNTPAYMPKANNQYINEDVKNRA
jgi:hypothetical protein